MEDEFEVAVERRISNLLRSGSSPRVFPNVVALLVGIVLGILAARIACLCLV